MAPTPMLAGPPNLPEKGGEDERPPLLDAKFESSFTARGQTKFRGAKFGDSDAYNFNLSASTLVPLNEGWFLPIELQSQYFALDALAGVPLPDNIHTLELGLGLAYRPNDRWMFMARFSPMLHKLDEVGGNDIGFSGGLMAEWTSSPSVKWMFGLIGQPNNDLPVLPLVGVDWTINERWALQLMFPKPRLIYSLDEQWKFHVGMDLILGTTFRASDTLGTSIGLPRYNDALGSYSDIRVGGGVGYRLSKSFSLEAEAGYSVSREIEYTKIDEKVKFDPAPYVRLGLRFEF